MDEPTKIWRTTTICPAPVWMKAVLTVQDDDGETTLEKIPVALIAIRVATVISDNDLPFAEEPETDSPEGTTQVVGLDPTSEFGSFDEVFEDQEEFLGYDCGILSDKDWIAKATLLKVARESRRRKNERNKEDDQLRRNSEDRLS